MSEDKWIRTELKEIVLYIFVGLMAFVILPTIGGFILKGFSEGFSSSFNVSNYLGAFLVYIFLGIGALFLIIFPISRLIAGDRGDHPATRKKPNWFTIFTVSLIHSPEENGALYRLFDYFGLKGNKNPMRWSLSAFRIFMISLLMFGFLGILQLSFPQLNVAGVPATQQITAVSDVIFGAGVPAFTENGVLYLIFFFLLGIDAYICSKFKLGLGTFFLLAFLIIVPTVAGFWMGFHAVVYGNSEAKLFATFVFAFIGLTLTLLLASFLPFFLWHFFNNFFIKLSRLTLFKEDIIFISMIIWVAILILYVGAEIWISRYRKKHPPEVPVIPR